MKTKNLAKISLSILFVLVMALSIAGIVSRPAEAAAVQTRVTTDFGDVYQYTVTGELLESVKHGTASPVTPTGSVANGAANNAQSIYLTDSKETLNTDGKLIYVPIKISVTVPAMTRYYLTFDVCASNLYRKVSDTNAASITTYAVYNLGYTDTSSELTFYPSYETAADDTSVVITPEIKDPREVFRYEIGRVDANSYGRIADTTISANFENTSTEEKTFEYWYGVMIAQQYGSKYSNTAYVSSLVTAVVNNVSAPLTHVHNDVGFNDWVSTTALPIAEGNYCLTEDITLSSIWNVPTGTTNLCLNGHKIDLGTEYILLDSGDVLNIYDCSADKTGEITSASASGYVIKNLGELTIFGGRILGARGINMSSNSKLNISGTAEISTTTSYGVYANASGAVVNITGGTITSESIGIYAGNTSTVNVSGGIINAKTNGIESQGSSTVLNIGGTAEINANLNYGINCVNGKLYLSGNPSITGAYVDIYVSGGTTTQLYAMSFDGALSYSDGAKALRLQFNTGTAKLDNPSYPLVYSVNDTNKAKFTLIQGGYMLCEYGTNLVLHQHSWSSSWSTDGTAHWHECTDGDCTLTDNTQKGGYSLHIPGTDDGDCTTATLCLICKKVVKDAVSSWHSYTNLCDATCNNEGCKYTRVPEHRFDNDCDGECNICGEIRTVPDHVYDHDCDAYCNVCNGERVLLTHSYIDTNGDCVCDNCGRFIFDGDGTEESPYIVMTELQLKAAVASKANLTNYVTLGGDITGAGTFEHLPEHNYLVLDLNGNTLSFAPGHNMSLRNHITIKNGKISVEVGLTGYAVYANGDWFAFENIEMTSNGNGMIFHWGVIKISNTKIVADGEYGLDLRGGGTTVIEHVYLSSSQNAYYMEKSYNITIDGTSENSTYPEKIYHTHIDSDGDCVCDLGGEALHIPMADDGDCTTAIACSVCGLEAVAAKTHAWDNDCDTGCNNEGCNFTRTITHIPAEDDLNCETATVCTVCGTELISAKTHAWDNDCDTGCNNEGCNFTRTTTHTPAEDDGDCTTAVACTVCGLEAVAAKTHAWDNDCDAGCNNEGCIFTRTTTHTPAEDDGDCTTAVACTVCGTEVISAKTHAWDNDCDTGCNNEGCNFTRTITHTPAEDDGDCTTAVACTVCGTEITAARIAHTGGTATCSARAECEVCGKEYGDTSAHSYTITEHDATYHWNKCALCDAIDEKILHSFGDGDICDVCGYETAVTPPAPPASEKVTVTVQNGTVGEGETSVSVNKNGSVTVVANQAPEGKIFRGWQINGVTVSTLSVYTFEAAEDINIVAIYSPAAVIEQAPSGLPIEAIMGIALAVIILLTIIGVAIFKN